MVNAEKLYLLIAELRDFYDVERQLTKALSKLPEGNSWCALRDAFETHLTETRREVGRRERMIEGLWETVRNHRDDVPPSAPSTAVRVTVRSCASTPQAGVPHSREDYDHGDDGETLVAWARAIGDDGFDSGGPDDGLETESGHPEHE
jgi:hypothetical protein